MEEPNNSSTDYQIDIFQDTRPSPKPGKLSSDLAASSNPPVQKQPATHVSWSSQVAKKSASDYETNSRIFYRWRNSADTWTGGGCGTVDSVLRSYRPTDPDIFWHTKESFEDLLKTANIPDSCFSLRSFTTWDVLLPSEEVAKNWPVAISPHEYSGSNRNIEVTVCIVSMQLCGDVFTTY